MDEDGDDKDDTKRRSRNLSEKKRRDQFNTLVNELSAMVSTNNRKMDKSTVLKATISFLKNHNEITVRSRAHEIHEDWKPSFLSNEEFTYLVLEALESFIMVFSETGCIYYVSESITSLLGHHPRDIINSSIFDLIYEEDKPNLYNMLHNPGVGVESQQNKNEIQFKCHLQRGTMHFREATMYELIQFTGHFKSNLTTIENEDKGYQHDNNESRLLFVCTGRMVTPQLIRDVSLVDTNRNEFTSRHSLEWKFLFLDQRAPPIIGYLPFEVLGTSGYDYYHFDDLEKVAACHEALMQKGEMTSCYYRFLTKGQQWIWLQTRFYITYHQWNSKPEFVVCTHTVVSYEDVTKSLKQESELEAAVSEDGTNGMLEAATDDGAASGVSPSYMSEASEAFGNSYRNASQATSVKSSSLCSTSGTAATAGTATTPGNWTRPAQQYAAGSDTTSLSGESRFSRRNNSTENLETLQGPIEFFNNENAVMMVPQTQARTEPALVPQHGIGAQYLDPVPYFGAVGPVSAVSVMGLGGAARTPGILPLSVTPLPVIVASDQAQLQEQLHRKHEELQEMIMRQQEELRLVKEQLLLARLGILQPIINVQPNYENAEEMQPTQNRLPAPIAYEPNPRTNTNGYPPQQQQQQQLPPHSSSSQQNMPPQ